MHLQFVSQEMWSVFRSISICTMSSIVSNLITFNALHLLTGQRVAFNNAHQSFDSCVQPLYI